MNVIYCWTEGKAKEGKKGKREERKREKGTKSKEALYCYLGT